MIYKLRKKLILISMSAFLFVLLILIAAINVANYANVVKEADTLLEVLSDNHGRFPKEHDKDRPFGPHFSPETPYETRFFSVVLQPDTGTVIQTETSRIFSVSQNKAIEYAQEVFSSKETSGFLDNYRFSVKHDRDNLRIVFLDCSRSLDTFYRFLFVSIMISLAGFLVVFILITFFSKRIIRPIANSYERQRQFITDAGHELKTPLTIIRADTDVLELDLGENEWIEDIQKQTTRLTELVNHLIELARIEETDQALPMLELPLSDIIREAIEPFQTIAQTQNKNFSNTIEPMLSLKGNEISLYRLLQILLDNAVKYTPEGGTIDLSTQKQGNNITISIKNTISQPIKKEDLSKLFDRFYRLEASHNSETGGYGIGLSVAQAIVTAHNGKIQAIADDDKTLQINIQLPI